MEIYEMNPKPPPTADHIGKIVRARLPDLSPAMALHLSQALIRYRQLFDDPATHAVWREFRQALPSQRSAIIHRLEQIISFAEVFKKEAMPRSLSA